MFHEVLVVGHLGQDPELRYTPSGIPVARFSVAANRQWTNGDGEKQEEVTWFRVTAWRNLGEICNQYLTKGRLVLIKGGLQPEPDSGGPRIWTDKEGKPRASFDLTARVVKFLGNSGRESTDEEAAEMEENAQELEAVEDSIPF